jgi:hypothetical protein
MMLEMASSPGGGLRRIREGGEKGGEEGRGREKEGRGWERKLLEESFGQCGVLDCHDAGYGKLTWRRIREEGGRGGRGRRERREKEGRGRERKGGGKGMEREKNPLASVGLWTDVMLESSLGGG